MGDLLKNDGFLLQEALLSVLIVTTIVAIVTMLFTLHYKINFTIQQQWEEEKQHNAEIIWQMQKYEQNEEVY